MSSLPNEKMHSMPNRRKLPWSVFSLFVKGGAELKAMFGSDIAQMYSNYYFSADQVAKYLHFSRNKPKKEFIGQIEFLGAPARKSIFYLQRKKLESPPPTPIQKKASSSSPSKKSSSKVDAERPVQGSKPRSLQSLIEGCTRPKAPKTFRNSLTCLFEDESTNLATQDSRSEAESFELSVNIYEHGRNFVDHDHAAQYNSLKLSGKSDPLSSSLRKAELDQSPNERVPLEKLSSSAHLHPAKLPSPGSQKRQLSRNEKVSSSCTLHRLTKQIHLGKPNQFDLGNSEKRFAQNRKFSSHSGLNRTAKTSFITPGVSSIIKKYADLAQASQYPTPRAIASPDTHNQRTPVAFSKTFFSNNRSLTIQDKKPSTPIEVKAEQTNPTSRALLQRTFQSRYSKPTTSKHTFFSSTLRSLNEC